MSALDVALGRARPAKAKKRKSKARRAAVSTEYNLLLTATLCLLAFGAVMVFSASSTTQVLQNGGLADSAYYLQRTLIVGALGLVIMHFTARYGLGGIRRLTPVFLVGTMFLLLVVLGAGQSVNGATRWIGGGSFQIQPSELAKVALILYSADLLAREPKRVRSIKGFMPILLVTGAACLLIMIEPDMGTTMVVALGVAATLVAAGVVPRELGKIALVIGVGVLLLTIVEPYRMARLTSFLHPSNDSEGAGFQAEQAKIALGSGGLFGVGIGNGVQKAFYLPEAHTDMISAVIGEEARPGRDPRRRRPLRHVRLRRAADRPEGEGQLRQDPRRRADLDDPDHCDDQPLRGDGPGAADRRAAALHLLRELGAAQLPVRGRADPQRRPRRDRERREGPRWPVRETARSRRRALVRP